MAEVITISQGTARAVYDDRWRPILEALGPLHVQRASEVEFNHTTGQWEAVEISTGRTIARGHNRAAVIAAEVKHLEGKLTCPTL